MSSAVLQIKFLSDKAKNIYNNGELLAYQTDGSSGFDVRAISIVTQNGEKHDLSQDFILQGGQRIQIPTGISVAMDKTHEIQVRSRSGLAWKNGLFVLNSPGTVDSDYRGELCVILMNNSTEPFTIKLGDRIAQAVFCPVIRAEMIFVDELNETNRGSGGFGSTGHS
jgi:dUTP pyrophosphatase